MLNALQGSVSGSYASMKRALQPSKEPENTSGKAVSEKGLLSFESCHLITEQAMVAAYVGQPSLVPHPKVTHPATLGSIHYASRSSALSGPTPYWALFTRQQRTGRTGQESCWAWGLGPIQGFIDTEGGQSPTVLRLV